jgi:hypothetical protein
MAGMAGMAGMELRDGDHQLKKITWNQDFYGVSMGVGR